MIDSHDFGQDRGGVAPVRMHADQITIAVPIARALVDEQFPQWRGLPIRGIESAGTVNAIVRIGDELAARFPLRPGDPAAVRRGLEAEAEAARELAGRTRFPTPQPVAIGAPGPGYPMPWSVQTWLPGAVATDEDPGPSTAFARDLAELITGIRTIDTRGRQFRGPGRGGDLSAHDDWMRTCFANSDARLEVPRLRRMWEVMRELPRAAPDAMTHGDLIPGNILVSGGRLAGVLDVGGLGPADPALDLIAAWHLLEAQPRRVFRELLACDDLEWARGRAWAFEQAMGAHWYYADSNPAMARFARRTLDRILDDEDSGEAVGSTVAHRV